MELLPLLEFGSNGLIFAIILAAFKAIEIRKAKSNGGTIYTRITVLENRVRDLGDEVNEIQTELHQFHTQFCQFREEVRLMWAKQKAREDTLREVQDG